MESSAILSPSPSGKCSILLKRTGAPIAYVDDQRSILEMGVDSEDATVKEKAPDADETA